MNLEIRSSLSISYRPDIDGLRSIAILSVIGFHLFPDLFPDLFPGGFIGVDLFFVLSGFLITKIINKKIKERTFSLKNFYARRIRRIFPCLIIVFLVFLLYGWLVLFPHEFKSLGGNIFFGSLSISNFYLYNEIGYFDMIGDKKPFLHTWSLSVEEQFYLLFPVFIVLLNKDKFLKKNTALILAFLIMLSLILMFFLMRKDINLAFYMPVTRFWEIMAGALLANLSLEDVLRKKKLSDFFSTVGIALILVPIFYFNAKQPYPGWRALVPTLGSFFLIASGCYSWVNEKILSHKIFVFVGLISYPLYLLHWPIISFIKIIDPNILSVTIKILILVFVFLLATIIYYFVERKIRNSEQHAKTLIGLMFLISVMSYLIYQQKISPFVSHKFKEVHHVSQAFGEWDYPDSNLEAFTFCERTLYRIGTAKETVLFFGDSNIEQYAPRITQLLKNDSQSYKSAVFATGGGCLPVPKVSDKNHPHYLKFVETVLHYALKKDIDTIVLGAQWLSYFGGESSYFVEINSMELPLKNQNGIDAAYIELEKMIQNLINQQKKVCIILPMPLGKDFDPQSIFKRTLLGEWEFCIKNVDANLWRQRSKSVCEKLKKIATHNGAEIIDPTIYFCNESICKVSINGNPIYKDGGHLRPSYVRANITFLDKIMKK